MKRLILEQSSEEFYTSHSGLALVSACINRYSDLGLLCLGKSDYQAIAAMQEDDYFKQALGIGPDTFG